MLKLLGLSFRYFLPDKPVWLQPTFMLGLTPANPDRPSLPLAPASKTGAARVFLCPCLSTFAPLLRLLPLPPLLTSEPYHRDNSLLATLCHPMFYYCSNNTSQDRLKMSGQPGAMNKKFVIYERGGIRTKEMKWMCRSQSGYGDTIIILLWVAKNSPCLWFCQSEDQEAILCFSRARRTYTEITRNPGGTVLLLPRFIRRSKNRK